MPGRQMRPMNQVAPSQRATSPTLKTLLRDSQAGVAKTSPSIGRYGSVSTTESLKLAGADVLTGRLQGGSRGGQSAAGRSRPWRR
jgi:hypothetical protein